MQSACAVLYFLLWPDVLNRIFPHYDTKGAIFEEKKTLNIKCVFLVSLRHLSETFLILRITQQDIIIHVHTFPCKVPLFLLDFNIREKFSKKAQI